MILDFLLALLKNVGEILMVTIVIIGLIALADIIPMWIIITVLVALGLIIISWGEAKTINQIRKQNALILKINELESERCAIQSKLNQCSPESEKHLKYSLRIRELDAELDDLDLMLTNLCK